MVLLTLDGNVVGTSNLLVTPIACFILDRIAHQYEVIGLGNRTEWHGTRTHSHGKLESSKPKAPQAKENNGEIFALCIGVHDRDNILQGGEL